MSNITSAVDRLLADVEDAQQRRQRAWSPVALTRAAEHMVEDKAGGVSVSGDLLGVRQDWAADLAEVWTTSSFSIAPAVILVELSAGAPPIQLPVMTTPPTAGPQTGGQKGDVHSSAFEVDAQDATKIDASTVINMSQQLARTLPGGYMASLLRSAGAKEASDQIGAVVETGTAVADIAAAWAHFDTSRFTPDRLLCPPSLAPTYSDTGLGELGVEIVMSSSVSKAILLARGATVAFVSELLVEKVNPAMLGIEIAVGYIGTAAIEAEGVAVIG